MIVLSGQRMLLLLCFSVFVEVSLQSGDIIFESQSGHGPEQIVAVDRLPFFPLALVRGLTGDEADELRHAFLYGLFRLFRDFRVRRKGFFHYSAHVCDRKETVLFFRGAV